MVKTRNVNWSKLQGDSEKIMRKIHSPGGLEFTKNGEIPGTKFKSDGILVGKEFIIALEIESGQHHPDTNVSKYWMAMEANKGKLICLVHVITPKCTRKHRIELAKFIAARLEKIGRFQYYFIQPDATYTHQDVLDHIENAIRMQY